MKNERSQFVRYAMQTIACLGVIALFCVTIWIVSYNPNDYAASLKLKIALLDSAPSPRIIFVGGSGVALGIDSPMIEKATGLHSINMGIYGALGLRFMLLELKGKLRQGDTVILSPEHVVLQQPYYGDGFYLLEMLHANPAEIKNVMLPQDVEVMSRHLPSWLQRQIVKIYARYIGPAHTPTAAEKMSMLQAFNVYGDVQTSLAGDTHMTEESMKEDIPNFVHSVDPNVLALLSSFTKQSEASGVHVLYMPSTVPKEIVDGNTEAVALQTKQITEAVGENNIFGTEKDFAFPYYMYLDAEHPNEQGKEARTAEIITLLKPLLPQLLNTPSTLYH